MRSLTFYAAVLAAAGLLAMAPAAATAADRTLSGPSVQLVSHGCYGGYYRYPSYHGYSHYRPVPVYPRWHSAVPYPSYHRYHSYYGGVGPHVYHYRGPHVGFHFRW